MKKVFLKTILLSFVSLAVLTIPSCDNFFGAGLLKQNLEKEIEYLNQPEVSIQIELEESNQGKIYPNGNKDCRVTDIFSVTYKPSAEYQFVKWIVKDYKTGLELTDVLKIENPEELETDVEVIGIAENVYLFPLVYQRPAVETFSPVKLETGSPKDSSIVFTFTKKLSPDNDLSKIQITSAGDTVTSNYLTPVLNENILTIAANKNNLLDVKSGKTRTVTVRIPEDFYYEEGNTKVPVGSEITYSFSVNSTTNDKAEITISVPKTTGTVNPNGTGNYNIDDVIKLSYEPNENYTFVGWNVVLPEGESVSSVLSFDSLYDMNTSVTVLKDVKGISITPNAKFIPGVKSISPEMESNGVNCDSSIIIKFKSPMDIFSFRFEDSEIPEGAIKLLDKENYCYGYKLENDVYYKNIKIENKINGDNLNKYYCYPNLSFDKYVLSLTVDYENLLLPANSNDFVNILVKINTLGTVKDSDDNYMTGIYETQYRLNSNRDRTAPSDVKFFIAKNDEDLANAIETQNSPFTTKKHIEWEYEDFISNRARQLKLYVRGCETDNKINKVKVYETLVKNFNTIEIESENQTKLTGYCTGSFTAVEEEQDFWEGYLTYDFVSTNDGIVKLDFVVEDYLGNGNTICTYFVNKDTKISDQTLFIASENHIELPGTTTISNDDFGSYADITSIYPDSANKNIVDEAGECIFWISKLEDAVLIDRRGDLFWDYKRDGIDVFKYEVLWSESKEGLENGNCFSSGILGTETIIRYNPTYGYSK